MSALSTLPSTNRWRTARVWLARLAINASGFVLCYYLLAGVLWALGAHYFAPLVPRAGASYREGDGIMFTQGYLNTTTWVTCVPSVIFALALGGVALWRRWLWYAPGALLGLVLGTIPNALAADSQTCGGGWHATPHTAALLANGLGLVIAARPGARIAPYKELLMPGSSWLRMPRAQRALAGALLAGCDNNAGHHVGDAISNAEVRITLTSVATVPAYATIQPAAGDELVRLHVRYTNLRHTALSFNEVQFAVQNGGAAGDCGRGPQVGCSVPLDGTFARFNVEGIGGYLLQPGATLESDILFEVGKGAHNARLVYQPDGLEDIANFWWLLDL
jgi:hypothetical protein